MRPVPALVAAFLEMFLFLKALRRSTGNPFFKFSAAAFYFAEFYALICHPNLDARPSRGCAFFPWPARLAPMIPASPVPGWCAAKILLSKKMSVKALYPGTFDPPTNGHIDLIQRGAKIFGHLTVAVLNNPGKNPLFTVAERVEMLEEVVKSLPNVSVATFDGLMVEFARRQGATAVLRGIRAISDYEYEFQMALMNRRLAPEIETVFLQPAGRYSFISSRMLKEVFSFGGDVTGLVPPNVLKRLRGRMGK